LKYASFILVLTIGFIISIQTYGFVTPVHARSQGLGAAGVMLPDDANGLSNQAALAILKKVCFSIHAENSFLIPEFNTGAISLCVPTKNGTFGLTHWTYGNETYQECKTGLAFGKAFGKKLRAGIEMNYYSIRQYAGYRNLQAFIPAVGVQVLPINQLIIGLHITNPAGQSFYPKGYKTLPTVFRAGLGYYPGKDILFCLELIRESGHKPVYCGGIECICGKYLSFRMGVSSSERQQYSFGVGLQFEHMRSDLAIAHHPVLGYSPAITLMFALQSWKHYQP